MDTLSKILKKADACERRLPELPAAPTLPEGAELAGWIDHTLLKPDATAAQVQKLCQEAALFGFASVCINPAFVPLAAGLLRESPVKVCTVTGFPLGATLMTAKLFETLACLNEGATEIDMVINIGALKGQDYGLVLNEIEGTVQLAHNQNALVKVILEMALLTQREKIIACLLCQRAGVDFVKTSTGFGPGGATTQDVNLMYRLVGPKIKVKAAGGIRSLETAQAMMRAGATRLGTSAGVQILKGAAVAAAERASLGYDD